jgi:hypothetical protein
MLVCRGLTSQLQTPVFTLTIPQPYSTFGTRSFVNNQFQSAQATYNFSFSGNTHFVIIGAQTPNGLNNDSVILFMYGI